MLLLALIASVVVPSCTILCSLASQCLPTGGAVPPTSAAWSAATKAAEASLAARFESLADCLMRFLDVDGDGNLALAEFCRLDELLRRCGGHEG